MASRKTKGPKSRRADLAKRQTQRMEKRGVPTAKVAASSSSLEIRPNVGEAERVEDAAIFNKEYRNKLAESLQNEAVSVFESLELTRNGDFDAALDKLKDIARSSPYADWRLFVRGLHSFYLGDLETARQNWTRLDRTRRPARIASTLLQADCGQPLYDENPSDSESLVKHAKTLRLRSDAVAAAEAIAKVKHRNPSITFSVSQVAMLSSFLDSYRKLDPEFVSRVGQTCVGLAVHQGDMEVFDRLTRMVPGTACDPKWNRTRLIYAMDFEGAQAIAQKASLAYIDQDLPKLTHLQEKVREALVCKIYLILAEVSLNQNDRSGSFFSYRDSDIDYKRIDGLLRKAIESYPANRLAHQKLISSLESQLDVSRISKSDEEKLEKQLIVAKEKLVEAIPDDVETALELIDFYLEEDQLDQANALVMKLSGQRLEDPLAKALPWKLKLREAMRLSRRKTDLVLANKALDDAESLWPAWLNRNWLPFLRAGLALRSGDQAKFNQLTSTARQDQKIGDFVGEIMTFAALQQMNIPSSDLKPFRAGVERQIDKASEIALSDLFSVGSFFWDLVRTGLKHKGYRLQASKLGRAFADKIKTRDDKNLNATQIDAYSWGAHHRFWPLGNDYSPGPSITKLAMKEPRLAAVVLDWLLELDRFPDYRMIEFEPLIKLAKEAAKSEKDAFYRYQFDQAGDEANNIIAEVKAKEEQRKSFGPTSVFDDDEEDDDDYDDDDYDDSGCNCADCREKRALMSGLIDDDDEDDYEDDDDDDEEDTDDEFGNKFGEIFTDEIRKLPSILAKVFSKLGPIGLVEFNQLLESHILESHNHVTSPDEFIKTLGKLFPKYGISMLDALDFVMAFQTLDIEQYREKFPGGPYPDEKTGSQSRPVLSADELKASRKQRQKALEAKKREASQSRSPR